MTIKSFDRPAVRAVMDECEAALRAVAERHGLTLVRKTCSYRENECPVAFKLLTVVTDDDGEVVTPEAQEFVRNAAWYGMQASDLGREFTLRGKRFKVAGSKIRNRKYPIIAECVVTGKRFKLPAEDVAAVLVRQKAQDYEPGSPPMAAGSPTVPSVS